MDPGTLKEGSFYRIADGGDHIILEDRTKRGLEVRETSLDAPAGVEADKGIIHDADGTGRLVSVRWFFPKEGHTLEEVAARAEEMEARYAALRELTCPDD